MSHAIAPPQIHAPRRWRHSRLAAAALAACATVPAGASDPAAIAPYYRAVFLPTPSIGRLLPSGLDDHGRVVGFTVGTSVVPGQALTWAAASGLETLAAPGRLNAIAPTNGQMVGQVGEGFPLTPTSWSATGGGVPLASLYPGAHTVGFAGAVNDQGWVLAAGFDTATPPADALPRLQLLRPSAAPVDLGTVLDAANTMALAQGIAVGTQRSIVGDAWSYNAVVWTEAGGEQTFRVLGGDTFVNGVNRSGLVVGTTALSVGDDRGFLHDSQGGGGTLRSWFDFRPSDINDAGLVVGAGAGARASAWSGGAVIDLNTRTINLGQFELVGGFSHVNNRGQIVTLANPTAAGVAAGLRPTAVLLAACTDTCGQIKPFPNPPGTTLRIDGDWFDAFNEEDFVNSGRLELDTSVHNRGEGWLRGSGTVAVGAAGWVRNSARWSVGEGGRLELNGLFSQDADGATFFSRGTVAIGAEPALFDVARGSAVFDTGALVVQAAGVVRVGPSASWLMSGASFEQLGGVLGVQGTASLRGSQATVGGVLQVDGTLRVVPEPALATRSRVVVGGTGELALRGGSVLELRSADLEVQGGTVRSQAQASLEGSARLRVRDGGRLELNAHRLRVLDGAELQVEDAGTQARVAAGARLETVGPLAALRVRDGAELVVSGTLVNGGNLDLRDGGRLELGGLAAGLLNQPGALLQVGSGSELDLQADSVFVNEGQVALNGTVVVATGAELVSRSTGAITFAGGRLDVTGGRFAIDLGGRVDGLGTVHQTAGLTVVDGRLDNSAVVIDGGVLQGSGTVSATLVVGPGATVALGATPAAARPAAGAVAAREASLRSGASAAAAGGLRLEGAAEIQGATLALPVADWRARGGLSVADGGSLALVDARVQLNAEVGYGPDLNDRFRVLDAAGGSLTGADTLALEATGLAGGWAAALEPTAGGGARVRIDHAAAQSFGFDTIAPGVRVELAAGQLNDIAGGRLVVSEGELVIGGALAVREDAFLTSTGTLHIAPGGRLSTRGSVGQSGGEPLLNEGLLRVYEEGSLGHSAPLRNRGLIENAGAWFASSRVDNEAGARIVQIGQMSSFWLRNEGRFELEGEVVNSGWVDNLEGGVFVVAEGGSLRTAELNSGRYRDQLGRTQVDGRLQAEVVEFQGSRVSGRGVIAGTVGGDATFELGDGGAAPLTIEGVFGGVHAFELDITDAARFGTLTLLGDTALTGGLVTFWLTEGGYLPQAGDSFSWIAVSGDAASLATLDWRVMVRAEGFDYAWVPPDELSLSFDGRTLAVAVVPEPSTYGLMLAGLGLVAWLKRRRDGAAAATR